MDAQRDTNGCCVPRQVGSVLFPGAASCLENPASSWKARCSSALVMASDSDVKMLLNFVNLASSDIKAALDKSAPCRRSNASPRSIPGSRGASPAEGLNLT